MSDIQNEKTVRSLPLSRFNIFLQIAIVFAIIVSIKWLADSVNLVGAGSVAIWCGILIATLFMRKRGITWRDFGLKLPKGKRAWLLNIAIAIFTAVLIIAMLALLIEPLVAKLGLESIEAGPDRFAFFLGKPHLFIAYLVVIVWIGAAVGEEMFMRGFVMNGLFTFFGEGRMAWVAAILIHAVIFGFMHASQGWPGIIGTGFVALIFGTIYVVNKRQLFPLIIAHGLVNTIGLTAYYLSDGVIT